MPPFGSPFGPPSFGSSPFSSFPPALLLLIGIAATVVAYRAKTLAAPTPALALTGFSVDTVVGRVSVTGRATGLVGWLLTTMGLGNETTLTFNGEALTLVASSLAGESRHVVPVSRISATVTGF